MLRTQRRLRGQSDGVRGTFLNLGHANGVTPGLPRNSTARDKARRLQARSALRQTAERGSLRATAPGAAQAAARGLGDRKEGVMAGPTKPPARKAPARK